MVGNALLIRGFKFLWLGQELLFLPQPNERIRRLFHVLTDGRVSVPNRSDIPFPTTPIQRNRGAAAHFRFECANLKGCRLAVEPAFAHRIEPQGALEKSSNGSFRLGPQRRAATKVVERRAF